MHNKDVDENGVQWTKSRCFFCHMNCAILEGVKDGKLVEIRPNEEHGTVLCDRFGDKGKRAIKFHYHPKRINHVLKRVGKKGENKWEEMGYDEALDEVAGKLQKIKDEYGPEAVFSCEGTYRSDHLWARTRFMNLFGNPGNVVDPGTICWCYTYTVNMAMVGWPIEAMSPPTAPDADVVVIWGLRNDERYAPESEIWRTFMASLDREGEKPRVIVVDPVCIGAVQYADSWLAINPGTDALMILTWVNYMIEHNLYDEKFIKDWSNGPFLIRRDNGQLIRGSDVDKNGKFEDFVAWNTNADKAAVWCSDENHYYDTNVDAPIHGKFKVKMADGSKVDCLTAFDAIAERMREYTTERAASVCGVKESIIIEAVEIYATAGNGYIAWGIGGGDMAGYNATNCTVGKTLLRCLSGNIDVVGGEYIGDPGPVGESGEKHFPVRDSEMELCDHVTPETRAKFLGNDQFRTMSWKGFEKIDKHYKKMWNIPRPQMHQLLTSTTLCWDAILTGEPYPVKGIICWSSNPMIWASNTKHVYEALKALELLVVVEYWMTPTAALADYIFPAADSLERPCATTLEDSCDFMVGGDRGIKPEGDRRMDYDFFRGLGMRLGQENDWPWETYEDIIAYRVGRAGVSYEQFVDEGIVQPPQGLEFEKHKNILTNGQVRGFATPSRKAEIFPSVLQELGYDPIPTYREPMESPLSTPELAKEYPMRLTVSGRRSPMYHSEHRVPGNGTRSMWPYPIVKVHMHDGRRLGLRDGDWAWIESPRGRIKQQVKLGWDIALGTVQVAPSWWYPELPVEEPWLQGVWISNGNVLTDDSIESLDPGTATWCNRGLLCRIYPCIDPADRSDEETSLDDFMAGNTFFHKNYK